MKLVLGHPTLSFSMVHQETFTSKMQYVSVACESPLYVFFGSDIHLHPNKRKLHCLDASNTAGVDAFSCHHSFIGVYIIRAIPLKDILCNE